MTLDDSIFILLDWVLKFRFSLGRCTEACALGFFFFSGPPRYTAWEIQGASDIGIHIVRESVLRSGQQNVTGV